jgi:mRNA-degrading endonuclease RelE of RelBE toxin-antitoxin system
MPTREILSQFLRDWTRLNPEQQEAFLAAVDKVVDDLRAGHGLPIRSSRQRRAWNSRRETSCT